MPLQSSLTLTLLADGILSQFTRTVSSNVSKKTGATVSIKINMALASLILPHSSIATNVTSTLNSQMSGSTVSSSPKSPCCSSAPFIENLKESKSTLKSQLSSIDAPPKDCIHRLRLSVLLASHCIVMSLGSWVNIGPVVSITVNSAKLVSLLLRQLS